MKKYIFATIIALTALTSCRLDNGSERDVDKVPRRLYNKMYNATLGGYLPYFNLVPLTEMLMDGSVTAEQIKKQFSYEAVIVEEGVYLFKQAGYYSYYVATDARPLSDGGEWSAGTVSNSDAPAELNERVAIKGHADEFTMSFASTTYGGWGDIVDITETEGEFVSTYEVEQAGSGRLTITHSVTTSAFYFYDGRAGEYNYTERYRIEWSSLEPIIIENSQVQSLAVDIRYTNLDSGTTRHVAAYINGSEQRFERFDE